MEPRISGRVRVERGGPSRSRGWCGGEAKPPGEVTLCTVSSGLFTFGSGAVFELSPEALFVAPPKSPGCLTLAPGTGLKPSRVMVTLRELDEVQLLRWQEALTEERNAVHLQFGEARSEFARKLHAELWQLFKSGRADLRGLYYSDWNGGSRMLMELLGKYTRMMQITSDLTAQDARAFAKLLAAAASDTVLRVVLLRLPLREGALAEFCKRAKPTRADFEAWLTDVQKRVKSWHAWNRAVFMRHHRHPAQGAEQSNTMCDDDELEWFDSLYEQGAKEAAELTLSEFHAAISAESAFLLASEYAVSGDIDSLVHVVRAIPREDCRKYAYPSLLFSVSHKHQAALLADFTAKGAVDAVFYKSLLNSGMTTARVSALLAFVRAFLFTREAPVFSSSAVAELTTTLQDFPVVLLTALHKATLVDSALEIDSDSARNVLELVLRFEDDVRAPGWGNVNTVGRWLKPGKQQAERAQLYGAVYGSSNFAGYVRRVYDENLAQWDVSTAPAGLAPVSSIPVANPFHRTKDEVCNLFFGFIRLGMLVDSSLVTATLAKLQRWEVTVMSPGAALRARVVDAILQMPQYKDIFADDDGGFVKLMRDGSLLSHHMHFDDGVLKAMCLPRQLAAGKDVELVFHVVSAGLALHHWSSLDGNVRDVWERTCTAEDRKEQLRRIVLRVLKRNRADFFELGKPGGVISFTDLDDCARYATEAIRTLSTAPATQAKMNGLFDFYLKESPPKSWVGLFKSAETIAFFLKYLDREDLEKAYAAFKSVNAGNELFEDLIQKVQAVYSEPILTSAEVQVTDPDAIDNFIARVLAAGKADPSVLGVLKQIAAKWMRKKYIEVKTPMAPRNAQIIIFLLCAEWAKRLLSGRAPDQQRALVARVGTGEGKSLIIGMLCIYAAKVLKKKVHVLEANQGLLERDYADMQDFYGKFDLTSAENDLGKGAHITYCLPDELDSYYRDGVGRGPFNDTVLIVDEVDALIVDSQANTSYVKPDTAAGNIKRVFDELARGAVSAQSRSDPLYNDASQAYQDAQQLLRNGQNQPKGYAIFGNKYRLLDSKGQVRENTYSLALEFLNYTKLGAEPQVKTTFFFQSKPHMLRQYSAIIGLSGSLGSPAEIAFLHDTYGAKTIDAPPFLDTCRGVSKKPPTLVGDEVQVHAGERAHTSAVVAAALKHRSAVPVVVLCKTPQAARTLLQAFPQVDRTRGAVQLYLQKDTDGEKMNYSAIVEKATTPCGTGKDKVWPITVSDLFGGRGVDYRITDLNVDDSGGLLVVAAYFPESQREWVQWKGRTARNDRAGQYAVILEHGTAPIGGKAALLAPYAAGTSASHRPALIDKLLEVRDEECNVKLQHVKRDNLSGMRMNELCDRFWTREGGFRGTWPGSPAQVKLRDFLNQHHDSFDDIADFAVNVGLASSAEAYKQNSAYPDLAG